MSKRKSTENGQQAFKRPSLPESCHIGDAAGSLPLNITIETVETDGEIDDDPLILFLTESTNESSSAQIENTPQPESETFKKVKRRCSSWVWKHTTLIQVKGQLDRYKCMYCEKTFIRSGTGGISRHLINKHTDKIKNTQCTMTNSGKLVPPFKQSSFKHPGVPKYCYTGKKKSFPRHMSDDELQHLSTEITDQSGSAQTEDIPHSESETQMKVKKRKSWIWKHASLIQVKGQPDRYKCVYCKKTFLRSGTGVISRHLMNKHNIKMKITPAPFSPTNSKKSVPPFKFDSEKADRDFLEFIVSNNESLSLGEEPAFRDLISCLQPLYKPMGRASVIDKLMSTFMETRDKVFTILKGSKVALTTDLRISPNKLAFMGITVSLFTKQFKPIDAIIGFKQILGEHSGSNFGDTFFETIKFFELQERMLSITTDNATSDETFIDHIVHLTKDSSQPFDKGFWVRCFAYVMNLCVQTMLGTISELLQKLRDLINSIRASPQRIRKFKTILESRGLHNEDYQEEEMVFPDGSVITDDLLPILDYTTQWSSTYYFVRRGVKLRPAIDEIAKEADLQRNEMDKEDWDILDQVLAFLEEFATITKYIEGSGFPTLSLVVPMYNRLLVILEDVSKGRHESITHPLIIKGAAAGLQQLSSYYDKSSPVVIAATFMDPRLKMQYFIENGWNCGEESLDAFQATDKKLITSRVKPTIQSVWKIYKETQVNEPVKTETTQNSKNSTGKRPAFNESYICNVLSKNRPVVKLEMDEMEEYEMEGTEPADCDPSAVFTYWANRSCRWPRLGRMAKEILSIPATSAASERAFILGKDIFGIADSNLNPEIVEALICLRSWYKIGLVGAKDVRRFLDEKFDVKLEGDSD